MADTFEWDDLLEFIEERKVIPVVGEQLLTVEHDGARVPLYGFLAARLAERLELDPATLPAQPGLNDVVSAQLALRKNPDDVYPRLRRLLREVPFEPPEPLRRLAEIDGFELFVSLTFDSLLEQAIDQARHGGEPRTLSLAYAPVGSDQADGCDDLPQSWKPPAREPVVFHLFGKVSASPDYAVSDEDLLEFVHALQTPTRRPPHLFDALASHHLLFLGCRYSDWLARFILRLSKNMRLSDRRTCREMLVDERLGEDRELVLFCRRFSSNTQVLARSAEDFIAELADRWGRRPPPAPSGASAARPAEAPDMTPGAVFISYASEDRAAALALHDALEAAAIDAWLDQRRLESGDHWDAKIRRHIQHCSLFVALVSGHTEARLEGYFRREWRWAAERAESFADGVPFILPVCLDGVHDPEQTRVPAAFRQAQWTRWPGQPAPEFVARLRELVRDFHKRHRG